MPFAIERDATWRGNQIEIAIFPTAYSLEIIMRHHTMRLIITGLLSTVLIACTAVARAELIYNGFASTDDLTLNGHSQTVTTSDGIVLRLAPAASFRSGSAFSTERVSTSRFQSIFSFRISNNGGITSGQNTTNGADGIAFVVQNNANNVGGAGGGIGYAGITPSIAVEFDTWHNPEHLDPSRSHVAIDLNGSVGHNNLNGPFVDLPSPAIDEGQRWWSWVLYDMNSLDVYLLQSESTIEPLRPDQPLLSYSLDLSAILGQQTAFAGFTAGTGSAWADHDILYWKYTTVPEPGSIVMVLAGAPLIVGAWHMRRRRGCVATIPSLYCLVRGIARWACRISNVCCCYLGMPRVLRVIFVTAIYLTVACSRPIAANAELIRGIDFPLGVLSFADEVLEYNPLFQGGPGPTHSWSIDPADALGIPDHPGGVNPGSVALGDGGRIALAFVNNLLINDGTSSVDLWVFEVGVDIEATDVSVRPTPETADLLSTSYSMDSFGFLPIGSIVGGTYGLDLDAAFPGFEPGLLHFDAVGLVDQLLESPSTPPYTFAGADIDAVGAISTIAIPEPSSIFVGLVGTACLLAFFARRHTCGRSRTSQ